MLTETLPIKTEISLNVSQINGSIAQSALYPDGSTTPAVFFLKASNQPEVNFVINPVYPTKDGVDNLTFPLPADTYIASIVSDLSGVTTVSHIGAICKATERVSFSLNLIDATVNGETIRQIKDQTTGKTINQVQPYKIQRLIIITNDLETGAVGRGVDNNPDELRRIYREAKEMAKSECEIKISIVDGIRFSKKI